MVFDPIEFLGRLAVLVPRPRINLVLYHGVLGPRASWRAQVVRRGGPTDDGATEPESVVPADSAATARRLLGPRTGLPSTADPR